MLMQLSAYTNRKETRKTNHRRSNGKRIQNIISTLLTQSSDSQKSMMTPMQTFKIEELEKAVKNMKTNKVPSPDEVPNVILEDIFHTSSNVLLNPCNNLAENTNRNRHIWIRKRYHHCSGSKKRTQTHGKRKPNRREYLCVDSSKRTTARAREDGGRYADEQKKD